MRLVYVTSGANPRVASYRMAQDTVRLWREHGHDAELARLGEEPADADAYVYCKCLPSARPRDSALVALHMHDFWDDEAGTLRATVARIEGQPVDVLVPCGQPYEERLRGLVRELGLGLRVEWCPESPVFSDPPPTRHPPPDGPFRVGFHGTGSTFRYLSGAPARGLERVAARFPLELVVLSNFPREVSEDALKTTLRMRRARVRYAPWTQETHAREMQCWDAAVLPAAHGSEYAVVKSSNRLREIVSHAVPVVAQRGNPDMEWFSEGGQNCALAGDANEWFRAIRRVLRYRGTRQTYLKRSAGRLMGVYGVAPVMRRWMSVFDA